MDDIAKIRDRLKRLDEHLMIEDMNPEIDVARLGHEPLQAIYASIQDLKDALLDVLWVLVEQEQEKLRALGIDPDAELGDDGGHESNGKSEGV